MTHEELRQWLDARGWSQVRLSKEIGMTPRQVNRWVTGRVVIPKWFIILKDKL